MDSEQPPPPPSYEAATAVSPTESPPPFEAAASAPAAVSGLAWHRSQAALSTRYGASGRKDMVSRAEQEREALLRTSGGTRCVVRGLKRTASQEKLDQAVWKTTQDKIRKHQEQQMRNCELEREKRNRELEEREAKRAAWAKETQEARKLMEAEQKVWEKKWPWQRWGKKSPKKRFEQEEAKRVEARKREQREWNRADGKVEFSSQRAGWSASTPQVIHHYHRSRGGGGGGGGSGDAFLGGMMGLALGIGMCGD